MDLIQPPDLRPHDDMVWLLSIQLSSLLRCVALSHSAVCMATYVCTNPLQQRLLLQLCCRSSPLVHECLVKSERKNVPKYFFCLKQSFIVCKEDIGIVFVSFAKSKNSLAMVWYPGKRLAKLC